MGYIDGTSAVEMLDTVFEVLEGGGEVASADIIEFVADNGSKIADVTMHEVNATNGLATEVAEVVSVESGATAGTATGAGILTMDVGLAGAAIAPALGIVAGAGLYNLTPEFWDNVANELTEAGCTVKGKVVCFLDNTGITSFSKRVIQIFYNAFCNELLANPQKITNNTLDGLPIVKPINRYNADVVGSVAEIPFKPLSVGGSPQVCTYTLEGVETSAKFVSGIFLGDREQGWGIWATTTNIVESVTRKITYSPAGGGVSIPGVMAEATLFGKTFYYAIVGTGANTFDENSGLSAYNDFGGLPYADIIPRLAYVLLYGDFSQTIPTQDDAILPAPGVEFPDRYPNWEPAEFPEPLPAEMPDNFPVSQPTPDSEQDPAQTGENAEPEQQDSLLNLFFNTLPDPDPHITPDPDPSVTPETEPTPNPKPDPDPSDPNPEPPTSDPTIGLPVLDTTSASRMFTVYNPTDAQLNSLGAFLWTNNIMEQIKKLWENPMDGIISLHKIYGAPTTGTSKNIVLGYIDSGVSALEVTNQFCEIDCGTIHVPERLHNATDYSPFTTLHIYLPFVGIVELDTNECMNAEMHVKYRIDTYTGTCVALIYLKRDVDIPQEQIIYTFSGNASQKLPLTASDFSGAIGALLGLVGAGVAVASGGSLGVAAGALGAAHSLTSEMVHVQHSGGLSANAGILSPRVPYIILSRQYGYDANGYNGFHGYPANKTVYIGNCNGYIKCKDVIFRGSCTEEEANEIVTLLKNGVYV